MTDTTPGIQTAEEARIIENRPPAKVSPNNTRDDAIARYEAGEPALSETDALIVQAHYELEDLPPVAEPDSVPVVASLLEDVPASDPDPQLTLDDAPSNPVDDPPVDLSTGDELPPSPAA